MIKLTFKEHASNNSYGKIMMPCDDVSRRMMKHFLSGTSICAYPNEFKIIEELSPFHNCEVELITLESSDHD